MLFNDAIAKFTGWRKFNSKAGTVQTYTINLRQFALYMRNSHIEKVSLEDVTGYLNMMTDLGWDKNQFMIKCMSIKKFFEFFRKLKIDVLDSELIPIPEREYKFPKMMAIEDYKKLLNVIPNDSDPTNIRNRTMLNVLWDCGVRLSELLELEVDKMDLVNMKCVIRTKKSRGIKPIRQIMWTKETNEQLKKWIKVRSKLSVIHDKEILFVGSARRYLGRKLHSGAVQQITAALSKKANLGFCCNPHRFRHAFGRDLAVKGANNAVISSMLGHSHMESSYVYTVLNDKSMDEQYTKFRRENG